MNRLSSAVAAGAMFVRFALGATALAALVACGGDDDPAQPPAGPGAATVSAAPDSATVAWNATAQIDVLANDTASSGALSVAAVGSAAHGSVAIVGGQLQYTPAAGYFGSDSIGYTAQTDDGGATASATVTVMVEARMQVSGVVSDAPLAAADVAVAVGTATFSTTTDALGQYSVNIAAAQPGDFVAVTASGAGAQSQVKLISLVGEAASLAGAASAAGEVSSAAVPGLNATHWSTAQAVLAGRANGGVFPTTATTLTAANASVRSNELLHLATLMRLVADAGVALPAGVGDTLALLQDSARLEVFSQSQVVGNAAAYAATQASVLADAPAVGPLGLAANGPQTLVYENAALVTFRGDGTASLLWTSYGGPRRADATWTDAAGTVTLTLLTPVEDITYSADLDPVTSNQNEIRVRQTGLVLRHVGGDRNAGTATVTLSGVATYVDGSRVGQTMPLGDLTGNASYLFNVTDVDRRMDIGAAELVAGSRWGGVRDHTISSWSSVGDVLRILDATQATFEGNGAAAQWTLADRWLTVTSAGKRIRYARLSVNASTGEERWLLVVQANGSDELALTVLMMRADPGIRFDAVVMARRWRWEDWLADFPADPVVFNLFGDGTGSTDFGNVVPGSGQRYNWSVDGEGRIVMLSSNRERIVTPLAYRNGQYFALLSNRSFNAMGNTTSVASTLVHRLADIGAGVKP